MKDAWDSLAGWGRTKSQDLCLPLKGCELGQQCLSQSPWDRMTGWQATPHCPSEALEGRTQEGRILGTSGLAVESTGMGFEDFWR